MAVAGAFLTGGCAGASEPAFLAEADAVAPAKYDEDAERLAAGQASCLRRANGESDSQISESIVYWSNGGVSAAEAQRFVPFALEHCGYLLSPEVKAEVDQAVSARSGQ